MIGGETITRHFSGIILLAPQGISLGQIASAQNAKTSS